MIDEDPDDGLAHFGMGIFHYKNGDISSAVDEFEEAMESNGREPLFAYYYGLSLFEAERYQEAWEEFSYVHDKRPDWERNLYFLYKSKDMKET